MNSLDPAPSNPPTSTPPAATGAPTTKHRDEVLAEQRGQTIKEAILLIEQLRAMEALVPLLQALHRFRTGMGTLHTQMEKAKAAVDQALHPSLVPPELVIDLHKCGRDTEAQLITLNAWIERHWKKLLRVLDVLVGPPGAVVAIIPAELLLPWAKAIDYVVKRGKVKLGNDIVALKPAPVVPVD
jgi:hypothetical protein